MIDRKEYFFSFQKNNYTLQTYRLKLKCYATVCNPIMVDNYAAVFNLHVGGSGVRLYNDPDRKAIHFIWLGPEHLPVAWSSGVQLVFYFCSGFHCYLAPMYIHRPAAYWICESSFFIHHGGYHD